MTLVSGLEVGCSATYASPLGEILLLSDRNALTGLYFPPQLNEDSRVAFRGMHQPESGRCFDDAKRYLDQYFAKRTIGSVPSLKLSGTRFQTLVWGQSGSLTGYAGGLEIKKWLLTHEEVLRLMPA
jgi:O6-methylguanine-DNA--protein-cysteine methyltransferase